MATTAAARSRAHSSLQEALYAYGFITPAIAAMVVASFIPIAFTVYVGFTSWDLYHNALVQGFHFVGLANYREIRDSLRGELLGVVIWTLAFASITTLANFGIGVFLAFLLNNPNMPERTLYRTILILPWALPASIMILVWSGLMNTDYGPINIMLQDLHLAKVSWLTDPTLARVSVLLVNAWLGFPFMMTACLGALQSISTDLTDAALVDGAGIIVRFLRITFPLLRSATLPLIISSFAYNLNNFGAVYLLTSGGPPKLGAIAGATDILPTYTYTLAFANQRYGLACAYAVVIFFFIGTLSGIQMKFSGAFEEVDR